MEERMRQENSRASFCSQAHDSQDVDVWRKKSSQSTRFRFWQVPFTCQNRSPSLIFFIGTTIGTKSGKRWLATTCYANVARRAKLECFAKFVIGWGHLTRRSWIFFAVPVPATRGKCSLLPYAAGSHSFASLSR